MEEFRHFSHNCALEWYESPWKRTCNICNKRSNLAYTCHKCDFHLCKLCSKLSPKLLHPLHPQHPLEFRRSQLFSKSSSFVCEGCAYVSLGSYYECQACEIKLDLECAATEISKRLWEIKTIYHYSHRHVLRRCRPMQDFTGSCLMCELPLTDTTLCFGCLHCLCFIHELCIDLPREIQHPVDQSHPLRRLSYMQHRERKIRCNACQDLISGIPFGCIECKFNLHIACADSLLRSLQHDSHQHGLFYVRSNARHAFTTEKPCQICKRPNKIFKNSYFRCVQCDVNFHFECLKIPEIVVKKSRHLHPLVCKVFMFKKGLWEYYCDVCETIMHMGGRAYSCKERDFLAHIECILCKEEPSPMYLNCLYTCHEDVTRAEKGTEAETSKHIEEIKIDGTTHTHILTTYIVNFGSKGYTCHMCRGIISGTAYQCEACQFVAHVSCVELRDPSIHPLHPSHPLTLLSTSPTDDNMVCDNCKKPFEGFNLFCRTCNYVIDLRCATEDTRPKQTLDSPIGNCPQGHRVLVQYPAYRKPICSICEQRIYSVAHFCFECKEIYHHQCPDVKEEVQDHPLHPNHTLILRRKPEATCSFCEYKLYLYGYSCRECEIHFHINCTNSVIGSLRTKYHEHSLYQLQVRGGGSLRDYSKLTNVCSICHRSCSHSFYGCIVCNLSTHIDCLGLPAYVKHQQHTHTLKLEHSSDKSESHDSSGESESHDLYCTICELECHPLHPRYYCEDCGIVAHVECTLSEDTMEAGTEEHENEK